MIGPNSSGLLAATIMTAHPAWQFPITAGLPSASGWSAITRSRNAASAWAMSLNRLTRLRLRQKADEIAGMTGMKGDPDLALRLEPANTGAMPSAWINHDERPLMLVDLDAGRGR